MILNNLFIILCRNVTQKLYNKYSQIGFDNIIFISDDNPDYIQHNVIYYDNKLMINNGFFGMHSTIKITSWDKAFYYLKNNLSNETYYWIIEDDCYINKHKMIEYINSLSNCMSDAILFGWHKSFIKGDNWRHWCKNKLIYFSKNNLHASINQIIRLSYKLVNTILEFQEKHNKFIFHELLIASIINKFNLSKKIEIHINIHCCALRNNSIIYKKYNNYDKKELLNEIEKNYIIIHPFKLWYDI